MFTWFCNNFDGIVLKANRRWAEHFADRVVVVWCAAAFRCCRRRRRSWENVFVDSDLIGGRRWSWANVFVDIHVVGGRSNRTGRHGQGEPDSLKIIICPKIIICFKNRLNWKILTFVLFYLANWIDITKRGTKKLQFLILLFSKLNHLGFFFDIQNKYLKNLKLTILITDKAFHLALIMCSWG